MRDIELFKYNHWANKSSQLDWSGVRRFELRKLAGEAWKKPLRGGFPPQTSILFDPQVRHEQGFPLENLNVSKTGSRRRRPKW